MKATKPAPRQLWTLSATTTPGLESIASREVREVTGRTATAPVRGRLELQGGGDEIFLLNYRSRSLHRIVLVLEECAFQGLEDLYSVVRGMSFPDILGGGQSFAVRASRHGDHAFTSMDAERTAGRAVIDAFVEKGWGRPPVRLDDPDVLVMLEIHEDRLRVGLDTTGARSLHRRDYGAMSHPAPLKSSLAYGLIRLSGWSSEECLLDPMCGSGTICIEAALWANRVPNWFRKDLAFRRLGFLDQARLRGMQREVDEAVRREPLDIRGSDISGKHVLRAAENARRAGAAVRVSRRDVAKVCLDSDCIVTNPPFGRRLGGGSRVETLYRTFLDRLLQHRWKRAVILTGRPDLFPVPEGSTRVDIRFGNLSAAVLILENAGR
jgi:tRNA (guanine6-N2)-methyltransferase